MEACDSGETIDGARDKNSVILEVIYNCSSNSRVENQLCTEYSVASAVVLQKIKGRRLWRTVGMGAVSGNRESYKWCEWVSITVTNLRPADDKGAHFRLHVEVRKYAAQDLLLV